MSIRSPFLLVLLCAGINLGWGWPAATQAQPDLPLIAREAPGLPVLQANGDSLANPWAGGFNFPRFGQLDLNLDGRLDLLVLDREDQRLRPFLAEGPSGAPHYRYAPSYRAFLPDSLIRGWLHTHDIDQDGDLDIFTTYPGSFTRVLRNLSNETGALNFDRPADYNPLQTFDKPDTSLAADPPPYDNTGLFQFNLPVPLTDQPAIVDVDFDGDLDILSYTPAGGRVFYYRNLALEAFGRTDTLYFALASTCWGHFNEVYNPPSFDILLENNPCKELFKGAGSGKTAHSGGGLMAADINGDSLMDIYTSDNGPAYMVGALNGGTSDTAHMTQRLQDFPPQNNNRLEIRNFPIAMQVDVNLDGEQDLLLSPNESTTSWDRHNAFYYRDSQPGPGKNYKFQDSTFLQGGMIDAGTAAVPVFFDEDFDGDADMLLANDYETRLDGSRESSLRLYRNTGSAADPVFQLADDDYLGFRADTSDTLRGLRPTLGDLNGDGTPELILGLERGELWLFQNNGDTANAQSAFQLVDNDFLNLGEENIKGLAPYLYDIDGDDDLDLLLGEEVDKNIRLYENLGPQSTPQFQLLTASFAQLSVRKPNRGFSTFPELTAFDLDQDSTDELIVTNTEAQALVFDSLETYDKAQNSSLDSLGKLLKWELPSTGRFHLGFYPTTKGDTIRLFAGMRAGGVHHFKMLPYRDTLRPDTARPDTSQADTSITDTTGREGGQPSLRERVKAYPNPNNGRFTLEAPAGSQALLYDATGRLLRRRAITKARTQWPLDELPNGLYWLRITKDGASTALKLLLQR